MVKIPYMHLWKCYDETPYYVSFNICEFKKLTSIGNHMYVFLIIFSVVSILEVFTFLYRCKRRAAWLQ
jgi:hypothetical protein